MTVVMRTFATTTLNVLIDLGQSCKSICSTQANIICHKYLLSAWLSLYFRAFNNVWSNIGYVIMGVIFIIIVAIRWEISLYYVEILYGISNYRRAIHKKCTSENNDDDHNTTNQVHCSGVRRYCICILCIYANMCAFQLLPSGTQKECHNSTASTLQWVKTLYEA